MAADDQDHPLGAEEQIGAAAAAFASMSEAEAMDWVDAGDYRSVAGIPLTAEESALLEECASLIETQGFEVGVGLQLSLADCSPDLQALITKMVDKSSPTLFAACCNGKHVNTAKIS